MSTRSSTSLPQHRRGPQGVGLACAQCVVLRESRDATRRAHRQNLRISPDLYSINGRFATLFTSLLSETSLRTQSDATGVLRNMAMRAMDQAFRNNPALPSLCMRGVPCPPDGDFPHAAECFKVLSRRHMRLVRLLRTCHGRISWTRC